jgi:uncharacterized protein YjiS (DUF1127 family)
VFHLPANRETTTPLPRKQRVTVGWHCAQPKLIKGMPVMTKMIRKWSRARRYRALARKLRSLSTQDLAALGIAPVEIDRLAFAATYA